MRGEMRHIVAKDSIAAMAELVLASLYLFLPAYAANMAPVIAKRFNLFPSLARPLDGGRTLWRSPLFGPHKTLRGLLVGLTAAVIVASLQRLGTRGEGVFRVLSAPPHEDTSALLWGSALGGGALVGDLVKSFVKRRLGIPPGQRWFPWDQLDLIVGALLVGRLLYSFPWEVIVVVLVATPLLGLLVNIGSYLASVKEAW